MTNSELDRVVAQEILSCKPYWWEAYRDWCCGCSDGSHQIDHQCSVLANYSADPAQAKRVAEAVRHLVRFDALDSPRTICLDALLAVRGAKARPPEAKSQCSSRS